MLEGLCWTVILTYCYIIPFTCTMTDVRWSFCPSARYVGELWLILLQLEIISVGSSSKLHFALIIVALS